MYIETERLILRQFELSDAEAVLKYSIDPEVTRFTGDAGAIATLEDAKNNMDLDEIIGMADVENLASRRVLTKLGFVEIDDLIIDGILAKLFKLILRA